jgi:hypothetical protein
LLSPLDRQTCVARLKAGIDSPWRVFGDKPIIGEVGPRYASLRRRLRWQRLFRISLDVSVLGDGADTTLICRRGPHPLAALLAGGWFGLLIAVVGLLSVFAVAGGLFEDVWPFLIMAPLILVAFLLAFLLGRGDPGGDHAFLIERLALMTDATPI